MADPILFSRAAKVSMSCLNVLGGTTPRHVECHKFVFLFKICISKMYFISSLSVHYVLTSSYYILSSSHSSMHPDTHSLSSYSPSLIQTHYPLTPPPPIKTPLIQAPTPSLTPSPRYPFPQGCGK